MTDNAQAAAQEYVAAGWTTCVIPAGGKAPRGRAWNAKGKAAALPGPGEGVGLCHAYSGTCAVDFDELDVATRHLAEHGIDAAALLAAPDAVMISSGRPNRAKLLYRLPVGVTCLQTKKPFGRALELRCGTAEGLTVQDVLPPSIHPDTGKPYVWVYNDELCGDWRSLPELPPALYKLWLWAVRRTSGVHTVDEPDDDLMVDPPLGLGHDELAGLLEQLDPDMPYDSDDTATGSWLKVGMALHHETGGSADGLALWDGWSSRGTKYKSTADLEQHWRSFSGKTYAITARWLRKAAGAATVRAAGADVLDARDTMACARALQERAFKLDGEAVLLRHAGRWYRHGGTHYLEMSDEAVRCATWQFLDGSQRYGKDDVEPFRPTAGQVSACADALRALTQVGDEPPPRWLGKPGPLPADLIALSNGLLHTPSRRLLEHSPAYFNLNALPFGWDASTPEPGNWLRFLDDLWGDDPESVDCLQEMFGYLLTPDTRQQKMFLLIGPPRSGKGTIGRVLHALLGAANVVGPTLSSLCERFGLEPLIGKLAAIIPDARLGPRSDASAIVERLLMVTGEDNITSDRKNTTAWSGRLTTRFVLMTNEIPRFADNSGALANRFIVLETRKSFLGAEDLTLDARIMAELPGIFLWALAGRERLTARGAFQQPASASDVVQEMATITSPVSAFIRDCCDLGFDKSVPCANLFEAWRDWCNEQGREHPGTAALFGRDLRAALGNAVRITNPSVDGKRGARWYSGLTLKAGVGSL